MLLSTRHVAEGFACMSIPPPKMWTLKTEILVLTFSLHAWHPVGSQHWCRRREWGVGQRTAHSNHSHFLNKFFINHHSTQKLYGAFIFKEQRELQELYSPGHWITEGRRSSWVADPRGGRTFWKGEEKQGMDTFPSEKAAEARREGNKRTGHPSTYLAHLHTSFVPGDSFPSPQNRC